MTVAMVPMVPMQVHLSTAKDVGVEKSSVLGKSYCIDGGFLDSRPLAFSAAFVCCRR